MEFLLGAEAGADADADAALLFAWRLQATTTPMTTTSTTPTGTAMATMRTVLDDESDDDAAAVVDAGGGLVAGGLTPPPDGAVVGGVAVVVVPTTSTLTVDTTAKVGAVGDWDATVFKFALKVSSVTVVLSDSAWAVVSARMDAVMETELNTTSRRLDETEEAVTEIRLMSMLSKFDRYWR